MTVIVRAFRSLPAELSPELEVPTPFDPGATRQAERAAVDRTVAPPSAPGAGGLTTTGQAGVLIVTGIAG